MRMQLGVGALLALSACSSLLGSNPVAKPGSLVVQPDTTPKGFTDTAVQAVSTFSLDVDTGSYTLTRRTLNEGGLPASTEVRAEEFLNYFHFEPPPTLTAPTAEHPLSVYFEAGPSPFRPELTLLRIGVKAHEFSPEQRKPVNLVFLIDTSGSMQGADRLGLIKYALGQLVMKLQPTDTLGIVTYAGSNRTLLEPTAVENKAAILDALAQLVSGGGTAGEAGIRGAYALAEKAKRDDGVNRVVLCTDGDFNIGATGSELTKLIESFRDKGIFLTTLGFGMGNYRDQTLEQLADKGNGNYGYIDSVSEANRMLGENLVSTLQVVAKDAKVQIAFDPTQVKRYRLIGYDNRRLDNEDFANDQVDSGDVGAGHHVTALYEVELTTPGGEPKALGEFRLRFKQPTADTSTEETQPLPREAVQSQLSETSSDFRFAAAVAEFAEALGDGATKSRLGAVIAELDASAAKSLPERAEVTELAKKAQSLARQ